MKRSIKLAVAAAVALSATSAFATNGDNLIGMGAKARGMGGVGIGMSHGAESGIANPAMIATVEGTEVSFGGTVFMPDVETDMGSGGGFIKSDADLSVIPEVAVAQNAGNGFTWGIGMYGVAGMGADYADEMGGYDAAATGAAAQAAGTAAAMAVYGAAGVMPGDDPAVDAAAQAAGMQAGMGTVFGALGQGNFGMKTTLQLMQFAVPLAYTTNGFTIAVAPVLQYGSLDIDYKLVDSNLNLVSGNTTGQSQDLGMGYSVGLAYTENMADIPGALTLGAVYKSAIDMEYDGVLSNASADFGLTGIDDHLEQPAEMGLGFSYALDGHTIAFDYKKVKWADAKGYEQFGWEDQDVYAVGYQYAMDNWAVRLGWNHAESPIEDQSGSMEGNTLNTLNLLGFPATIQDHYTVGGSYAFTKTTSLDLAYVYAEANDETFDSMIGTEITTKHTQDAVTAQLNFNF